MDVTASNSGASSARWLAITVFCGCGRGMRTSRTTTHVLTRAMRQNRAPRFAPAGKAFMFLLAIRKTGKKSRLIGKSIQAVVM